MFIYLLLPPAIGFTIIGLRQLITPLKQVSMWGFHVPGGWKTLETYLAANRYAAPQATLIGMFLLLAFTLAFLKQIDLSLSMVNILILTPLIILRLSMLHFVRRNFDEKGRKK